MYWKHGYPLLKHNLASDFIMQLNQEEHTFQYNSKIAYEALAGVPPEGTLAVQNFCSVFFMDHNIAHLPT